MHKLNYLNIQEDGVLFTELYQQHASVLLTRLMINLPSRMDAEDVLVDVFVTALEQQALLSTLSFKEQRLWLWRYAYTKAKANADAKSQGNTCADDHAMIHEFAMH